MAPTFHYRALDQDGALVVGSFDSPDEAAAASRLQAQGYLPVDVSTRPAGGVRALLAMEVLPRDRLRAADRMAVTRMLATLTGAGLPLDRSLEMTRDLATRAPVRAAAGRLLEAVRGGASLADAFDGERAAFPPLYRSMVRAGEVGAGLEDALARLADTLEQSAQRAGDLRSALIYPAFLLATAIASVAALLAFVVPAFHPLLEEGGVEPPWITRAVIAAGAFVQDYGPAMLLVLAAAFIGFLIALRNPALRERIHRLAFRMPIIGPLWRKTETARFSRLLGALLQNGVALPAALPLVRDALTNAGFAADVDAARSEVEAGRGLARPLAERAAGSPLARQFIEAGEESGL